MTYLIISFQFVILVIDSTDRERLLITKEELYKMLATEVCDILKLFYLRNALTLLCKEHTNNCGTFSGIDEGYGLNISQQARSERINVCHRDLTTAQFNIH